MRYTILYILLLFSSGHVLNQNVISGRIISENDHIPLVNSTISVFKANSGELVTGIIANDQGRFSITNLAIGEYDIKVSFLGYVQVTRKITAGSLNKALDLGNIMMKPDNVEIKTINVKGKLQAVFSAFEKKVYSSDTFIQGSTGSVLDIMKSLPGVTIDQESRVILRGSDKVAVLIDGKQSSLTGFGSQKGLDNIPASQIESIEIINNPSAKYEASGMAGIVNIKFKQAKFKGFTGDIGFTPGIGMLTKRKNDLPTGMPSYSDNLKFTPSLNLNYKTEQLNFFWQSYILRQQKLPNNEFSTRKYDNGNVTESQVAENRTQNHYNFKLGLD